MPTKEQYWNNREYYIKQSVEWRKNHPESSRKASKRWRDSHPGKHAEINRLWCRNNPDKLRMINRRSKKNQYDRLLQQVFVIIPNRCYYESVYCSGGLQWDHKNGDGKNCILNNLEKVRVILKDPDRWMRLCERHNKMKVNIPKDVFEAMVLELAERINMRSYAGAL